MQKAKNGGPIDGHRERVGRWRGLYMRNDRSRVPDDRDYQQDAGCNRGYDHRKKIKYPSYDANELAKMVAAGFNTDREGNRRKQEWR